MVSSNVLLLFLLWKFSVPLEICPSDRKQFLPETKWLGWAQRNHTVDEETLSMKLFDIVRPSSLLQEKPIKPTRGSGGPYSFSNALEREVLQSDDGT
jgi:hypothetical protein